ncbi:MAG: hypothetical protein HYR90_01650 [Candidatus Andersenbacteria bacterium]|nr:hypothetical protein [Candidatus Andersenbacteria bacterium]MBI3250864.1 hypothetical protein [Candidatus Andersenbacteria bacterium]
MRILRRIGLALQRWQAIFYVYFGRRYICGCGHTAKWKTVLTIHGHSGVYAPQSKKPDWCPECWAKAAIKCAWCGNTILPGDAITLYIPTKEDFQIPEHAVVYKREPQVQLVGCLGWDCAMSGADRAGFWVMPGKVQRVMSPMEKLMANGGLEVVVENDLTDPAQAIPIPDEI